MGLHSPSKSSMFSKSKSPSPALANASAYLAAVADRDRQVRAQSPSSGASISTASTPALSMSSSITGVDTLSEDGRMLDRYSDLDDDLDADDDETGLARPSVPPTSEQVFNTRHLEFGHCANQEYRYTSACDPNEPFKPHVGSEPPYYIILTTYLSYLIFIVIGHMRDFFGKKLNARKYRHVMPSDVSPFLTSANHAFSAEPFFRITGLRRPELGLRLVLHSPHQAPYR